MCRRHGRLVMVASLAVACLMAMAGPARAAAPDLLMGIPADKEDKGGEAGQLDNPRAVDGDPESGHIFISDLANTRINEYTAWGEFVKAWGWDVSPEGAPGDTPSDELEICTTQCQPGDPGTGPGQFVRPDGLAIDDDGNIFVYDTRFGDVDNYRVQKFDSDGNWLLMFGGEVNKTTGADICTKADVDAGEVCGAGVEGTDGGWFSNSSLYDYLAYGSDSDSLFVGDAGRIQEFDLEGNFIRGISLPGSLAGRTVAGLDVDAAGNLYVATSNPTALEDVFKLSPSGDLLLTFDVPSPESVTVDVSGNVYVVNAGRGFGIKATRKYLPSGTLDGEIPGDEEVVLRAVGTNFCPGSGPPGNVYTVNFSSSTFAYVNAYGTGPIGCEPPPPVPPEVLAQYATSVGSKGAVLGAEINPNFFADTTYFVQYGTTPCSAGGCAETPVPPGVLSDKVTNRVVSTGGIVLDGLLPGTTYRFRFVAESAGGGPVFGPEETFTTFSPPDTSSPPCANEVFRIGSGALLPDCRAYEMVSPIDKNNGDIVSSYTFSAEPTTFYQSATSGGRFAYSSARSFAGPDGAPYTSQYLSMRTGAGWQSQSISPPRTRVATLTDFQKNQFKAFTADLCQGWLRHDADPPLTPDAEKEFGNLYRRDNCGPAGYEALTTAPAADRVPVYQEIGQQFAVELQGVAEDGSRAIFVANDDLEGTGAPDIGESTESDADSTQLYEHSKAGGLRFVCILPGGNPVKEACAAGTSVPWGSIVSHLFSNIENAISADGSRIFWTAAKDVGPGRIYVRIDGATTVAVSVPVSPEPARWWGAAEDGSVGVFSFTAGPKAEELYAFHVDAKKPELIAPGVVGVMGMSDDVSRIYFASTKALGGEGTEGEPNLYLWEDGSGTSYIATLPESELINFSPIAARPSNRTARVSPDGLHAVFSSRGSVTGYDNADAATGQPDTEVFLYDATEGSVDCLSCNPTGARPSGKNGIAGTIPPWERSLYASRSLSDDGQRVFFESFDRLALRDTNGAQDVYQWEAEGAGSCDAKDASFQAAPGGCVELISSAQSARESVFLDATPSGDDVFITTLSSLVPWDPDAVDVYDAHVAGGFPPPLPPRDPCEGGTCQSPSPPAAAPAAATAATRPGNPVFRKRCPKGKRRIKRNGKVRCVKKRRPVKQAKRRRARR